jgi:uncharacterized protein (DUF1697 family)
MVVFLRGVNVGGHRTFRPTELVRRLAHLDLVNIGAAGTFVVRARLTQARIRAEVARALPFATDIALVPGRDVLALLERPLFAGQPERPDITRFITVLCEPPARAPRLPVRFPSSGKWLTQLLAHEGRFVAGVYRRDMKAINFLGEVDRLFGVSSTTRNWNTMLKIAGVLRDASA